MKLNPLTVNITNIQSFITWIMYKRARFIVYTHTAFEVFLGLLFKCTLDNSPAIEYSQFQGVKLLLLLIHA